MYPTALTSASLLLDDSAPAGERDDLRPCCRGEPVASCGLTFGVWVPLGDAFLLPGMLFCFAGFVDGRLVLLAAVRSDAFPARLPAIADTGGGPFGCFGMSGCGGLGSIYVLGTCGFLWMQLLMISFTSSRRQYSPLSSLA